MSSDLFSQITYQLGSDLFAHIPIHHDSDKLIAQVKQLLQHAICIDHKKILSDDTCRIFEISTPQEAIATFVANSIPSELLYPAILSLAEAECYYSQDQDQDQDQYDEQVEEEEEEDIVDLMIQHEINEHRINDGPDPTFDGTYEIGSDDPPEDDDESEDGYVDEYEGDSDEDDEDEEDEEDVEEDEDDYSQEEDE